MLVFNVLVYVLGLLSSGQRSDLNPILTVEPFFMKQSLISKWEGAAPVYGGMLMF